MAHDEKISEPTGNDVHHEPPASASAPAQVPDVATLRAMMHERQYAAGKALEQQLEADVLHAREVQEELLFEMIEANKDTPFGRDHDFADIKTVEDFKRTVPLHQLRRLRRLYLRGDGARYARRGDHRGNRALQ